MSLNIETRRLTAYHPDDAAAIGKLIPFVNNTHDGSPIPEDVMRDIIESDRSDQYVAAVHNKIVGTLTLNLIITTNARKAYLDNFVTHPEYRGQGVGSALWDCLEDWTRLQDVRVLDFLSGYERDDAHSFYKHRGVQIMKDLVPFRGFFQD
jgi:GNAT superfamily N-acetyltransferase